MTTDFELQFKNFISGCKSYSLENFGKLLLNLLGNLNISEYKFYIDHINFGIFVDYELYLLLDIFVWLFKKPDDLN